MARAIVRYSLDGGNPSTHTYLTNYLTGRGFTKIGTASFEAPDELMSELLVTLGEVMAAHLADPQRGGGRLDHLWVYLDEPAGGPGADPAPPPISN